MNGVHTTVLLQEAVDALAIRPAGRYLDGTFGRGGHSRAILDRLGADGHLFALDRDPQAAATAATWNDARFSFARCPFSQMATAFAEVGAGSLDGVLLDLGVSSPQLDQAERGFSFNKEGPLDMRMDRRRARSAYTVVNEYSAEELTEIFYTYGEERWAKRIAAFIEESRNSRPIETTGELVDIIDRAVPKAVRAKGGHPAKRVFQAIRIEVNEELTILSDALRDAVHALRTGGRLAVITFHSLEDRIVKRAMQEAARGCICPPHTPVCICGHAPEVRLIGKARAASAAECAENPRARSAKLRVAEKI